MLMQLHKPVTQAELDSAMSVQGRNDWTYQLTKTSMEETLGFYSRAG